MQREIAVSSYSLRQCLGPIRLSFRGPDGHQQPFVWDQPQSMTLLEFPAAVKEQLGLSAVEICQFHLPERTAEYVAELSQALKSAGIQLLNMPIDVGNISGTNPDYREEDLSEIEDWMRIAAQLGSRMVRVNASMAMAAGPIAPLEVTIASYRRLVRTAQTLGMQLLLENHGGITADPAVIIEIVETVTELKTLVDIGNFEPMLSYQMAVMQGKEPPILDVTPIYAAIARIAPYAGLVHAKTYGFDDAGQPLHLDVRRALRVVQDAGYHGPISLEYEGSQGEPWEQTRRTLALVTEVFGDS